MSSMPLVILYVKTMANSIGTTEYGLSYVSKAWLMIHAIYNIASYFQSIDTFHRSEDSLANQSIFFRLVHFVM